MLDMPQMSALAARWRRLLEDPGEAARMFPSLAGAMAQPTERRRVLKLMAASLAMGGLAGCDPSTPDGHWVPAVIAPPGILPGIPNFYSTAHVVDGSALGIVVEHRMGRPMKVEGNAGHPSSLGATDALAQAVLLDFYDPDRALGLLHDDAPTDSQSVVTALAGARARCAATRGAGLRILTGTVGSPTLGAAIDGLLRHYPEARWVQWDPASRDTVRAGAALAFGRPVDVLPKLAQADVVLALDSDLISSAPGHVRHARDLMSRRNPARGAMSRLYAAEPSPTLIGSVADHRFITEPQELHAGIMALAAGLLRNETPSDAPSWVAPVLADLRGAPGRAFIHAGPSQPAETHALVHAMNAALGGRGPVFDLVEPAAYRADDQAAGMHGLLEDMQAGRVETLLVLDCNPVFTAPGFRDALQRVRFSLSTAPAPDETAHAVHWHVPQAHLFETWGDARGHDGTATILQPQALPLFQGRSVMDTLSLFLDGTPVKALDAVRETWRARLDSDDAWQDALAEGVIAGTASSKLDVALRPEAAGVSPPAPVQAPITVLFRPDPHLWDGRYANNPWLQELPRPLTKLTWDNPILVSPAIARRLGLVNGDNARLSVDGRDMLAPVWIMPGQAAGCIVANFGAGRAQVGEVGRGAGFDVYPLRGAGARHAAEALLAKAEGTTKLASTEHHAYLDSIPADIARHGTLAAFAADPTFLQDKKPEERLYLQKPKAAVAWGMSVDLNACIGCNACVVACTAENNVPVVGKENVLRQREMHWLRIDRYYEGAADAPDMINQPMLCMHCEEAPCETVCPVEASVHDEEGLNVQVYNRCVGTRFCSNNCPYKVRRFNFGPYVEQEHRPAISRNPDVDARARGVMEKCTFCIQRIAAARIAHDRDGVAEQAVTACQAACPTQAFSFGDLNDPASDVVRRKKSPLDYAVLAELQTHPRLTYEARIRNPNPDVAA